MLLTIATVHSETTEVHIVCKVVVVSNFSANIWIVKFQCRDGTVTLTHVYLFVSETKRAHHSCLNDTQGCSAK